MKDLEKIKSEDLAAQVQDANPANFAIEQEVAQLVGATVPAPTQPSADDARELGAQLLVFLRRALLPIRSALRTALAAIYAHLDSRCTDYTPAAYASFQDPSTVLPYDPMRPLTPRTLPNLLTAITAFSARKISNGSAPNDGIPDGISLAQIVCGDYTNITKVIDDNADWTYTYGAISRLMTTFPNLVVIKLLCSGKISESSIRNISTLKVIEIDNIEEIEVPRVSDYVLYNNTALEEFIAPKVTKAYSDWSAFVFKQCTNLRRLVLGTLTKFRQGFTEETTINLIDLEIGAGTAINLDFTYWNPTNVLSDADKTATFLQNFRDHIALRLTSNGSGLTLTLSQAVRDAIHAAESTYGIENIIVTQKGWTISPAPN